MKHFGIYLCQGENKDPQEYDKRTQKQNKDTDNPGPMEDEEVLVQAAQLL